MKLNTDIKELVKGKKQVYPTKRSMNLYFKVDRSTAPATMALYILFAVVVTFALGKVMIYDPWSEVKQMENYALSLDEQSAQKMVQLKEYNNVLKDYTRATLTKDERSQLDRMRILALIDSTIRPAAKVSQISISDNKVLLTFSEVTLGQAGQLVSLLDESPLVTNISVDTAASNRGQDEKIVEAHVYFEVVKGEGANS